MAEKQQWEQRLSGYDLCIWHLEDGKLCRRDRAEDFPVCLAHRSSFKKWQSAKEAEEKEFGMVPPPSVPTESSKEQSQSLGETMNEPDTPY